MPDPAFASCVLRLNANPALLNRAVFGNNVAMVTMLLEAKADPDAGAKAPPQRPFGGEGWPLRLAVQHGFTEICGLLLTHGARLEPPRAGGAGSPMGIHSGEDDSGSLLGAAAFKGHVKIVELLLNAQADVNGRGENGKLPTFLTPLMHAACVSTCEPFHGPV